MQSVRNINGSKFPLKLFPFNQGSSINVINVHINVHPTSLVRPAMSTPTITITIKLFAAFQDAYGQGELQRQILVGTTVADILQQLLAERPELERWRSLTRFGVNCQFVSPETVLQSGDELVMIPPVSGG